MGVRVRGAVLLIIAIGATTTFADGAPPAPSKDPKAYCHDSTGGDHDGDGIKAIECGGYDCDDSDPRRYPGRPEVCDLTGHDEDCDPCTVAQSLHVSQVDGDRDSDGFIDTRCFNTSNSDATCDWHVMSISHAGGVYTIRGLDCDDGNRSLIAGSQVCTPDLTGVKVCVPPSSGDVHRDGPWDVRPCPAGRSGPGRCVPQPNGTGLCVN